MSKFEDEFADLESPIDIPQRPVVPVPIPEPVAAKPVAPPVAVPDASPRLPRLSPLPVDRRSDPMNTVATSSRAATTTLVGAVIGGLGLLVLFLSILLVRTWFPSDNEIDSGFNINGTAVLVLEDEDSNPRHSWDAGQVDTLVAIRKWASEHVGKINDLPAYQNFDVKQDIRKMDPFWADLKSKAALEPPTVLVVKGKRLTEFAVPPDDATAIKALEAASR